MNPFVLPRTSCKLVEHLSRNISFNHAKPGTLEFREQDFEDIKNSKDRSQILISLALNMISFFRENNDCTTELVLGMLDRDDLIRLDGLTPNGSFKGIVDICMVVHHARSHFLDTI